MVTIDYETEAIVGNPVVTPPKPVGCSVLVDGYEPVYYAWGHPTGNNITWGDFHQYLMRIKECGDELLFHNAPFDLSVQHDNFCNARHDWINKGWRRIHDTMFLLFLMDPYAATFSLKPSAERYLGMPATEQDELHRWILDNVPEATHKTAGAFICRAPGELVGRYANGDTLRTRKLFEYLHPIICEKGMQEAYDRERRLMPILMDGTRRGIRIDRGLLEYHTEVYNGCLEETNNRIVVALGSDHSIFDSDNAFADALERSGAVKEWVYTPKSGKRSMSKDNLRIVDPNVRMLLSYKSNLETCLQTFMRPWLALSAPDGRLHPNWNQVRQPKGDKFSKGTRTGRLSSDSPNFQNVPTEFVDAQGNPLGVPDGLHPLPQLRSYCLPEYGHLWAKRDYSSQEIRILAHFEDGSLCEAYKVDPFLDPHQMAREIIFGLIGIDYARKSVKITGFSIIYGTGGPGLAAQLAVPVEEARAIKSAYLEAMPGVRDLMFDVQARGRRGEAIRTWGGRLYVAEPPKLIDGQWRDFAYKLLNYLIQGSAADQTKEAICDWEDCRSWDSIFLATVHDEINISVPKEAAARHMNVLQQCMERDRFDVPSMSEGFMGENWADIKEWDDEKATFKTDCG